MNDKQDVPERARAEYDCWEQLLSGLSESQILAKELDGGWSVKDVIGVNPQKWTSRSGKI